MSKKSFIGGLGSLLEDSIARVNEEQRIDAEENQKNEAEKVLILESKIAMLLEELHKWRTGELDVHKFHTTLKEYKLKYNSDSNIFEKI